MDALDTPKELTRISAPANPYFLVCATIVLFVIIVWYLIYVYIVGPRYMKDRPPQKLKNRIRCYNVFQIIACTIFVVRSYQLGFDFRFLWKCESFDWLSEYEFQQVYIGTWLFLCLRLYEFVETVFFIKRKKFNQASFLHVYHHVSTVILMWIFIVFDTEWMAIYNASINSFVHMLMYTYYLLSSYPSLQSKLYWFKPILTVIQLIQFVLICGHCIVAVLPSCPASGIFFKLQIANLIMLTILFSHFFITNYLKKGQKVPVNEI